MIRVEIKEEKRKQVNSEVTDVTQEDMETKKLITQYFSKWRGIWVDFKNQPVPKGEIIAMKKYKYKLR